MLGEMWALDCFVGSSFTIWMFLKRIYQFIWSEMRVKITVCKKHPPQKMKEQEESLQARSIFYGKLLPQNRFDRRFVRVMAAVVPVWQNHAAPLLNGFRSTFIDQNKDSLSLCGLVADFRVASHLFISKWCEGFRCPHDTLLHTHRENITMTTGALTKVRDDLFPAEGHKSFSPPTHTQRPAHYRNMEDRTT